MGDDDDDSDGGMEDNRDEDIEHSWVKTITNVYRKVISQKLVTYW